MRGISYCTILYICIYLLCIILYQIRLGIKFLILSLTVTFYLTKTENRTKKSPDHASGIRLLECSKLAINQKIDNDITIFWHEVIVNFFNGVMFPLSSLVTGPSFMSMSLLVLELWQFSFLRDWPEIRKSETLLSVFYPNWDE